MPGGKLMRRIARKHRNGVRSAILEDNTNLPKVARNSRAIFPRPLESQKTAHICLF
jgi:hypothetical protein